MKLLKVVMRVLLVTLLRFLLLGVNKNVMSFHCNFHLGIVLNG